MAYSRPSPATEALVELATGPQDREDQHRGDDLSGAEGRGVPR